MNKQEGVSKSDAFERKRLKKRVAVGTDED